MIVKSGWKSDKNEIQKEGTTIWTYLIKEQRV